ncbi:hypothetical protein G9A89_011590 [Geosiphon pyriformis]|nr:hypothetical protein G9A89_011590 [Geosiphon pyriformis]
MQQPIYVLPIYQPATPIIYQSPQPQLIYQSQPIQIPPQMTVPNGNQRPKTIQQNWKLAIIVYQLIFSTSQQLLESHPRNSETKYAQNLSSQNYLSLLVIPEKALPNNLEINPKPLTNNILSATVINNKLLAAIFLFKIKEPTEVPLFSGATFDVKPITMMYMDAKVNGQSIKLILNSESADSIIT